MLSNLGGPQPLVGFLSAWFSLVHANQVLPETSSILERALAQRASAWSLACVDALMVLEVLQAAEALPAHRAGVRLLARVRASVLAQAIQVAETRTTLAARIWLLTCVDAQMRLERAGFTESSPTHAARVRFLSRVDAQVLLQAREQPECLATLQAEVWSLTGYLTHQLRRWASTPAGIRGGVTCARALPRSCCGHGSRGGAETRRPLRRCSSGGRRRAVMRAGRGRMFSGVSPGTWNTLLFHHVDKTLVTLTLATMFSVASDTHRP